MIPFLLIGMMCGCSGDDDPVDVLSDPDCIGPGGGVVEETDPEHSLYGVRVEVAQDAWQECWSVYMWYQWTFSTPNFPDGLHGYEGMLSGSVDLQVGRQVTHEQWIDAPDSLDMEISFPLRDLTTEVGEKLAAFRYDSDLGLYRLAFPDRLDAERMTITTHRRDSLWTWGKVELGEVDFDTYLKPVMEDLHGAGAWLEVQAELDRLHDEIVAQQLAMTCEALDIVQGSFAAARDAAADNLREFQDSLGGACGTCDVTTSLFYEELVDYAQLSVQAYIAKLFLIDNSPHFLVTIYGYIMVGFINGAIAQLDCDYPCFAEETTLEFYVNLAYYYVSAAFVEIIEIAKRPGAFDCP